MEQKPKLTAREFLAIYGRNRAVVERRAFEHRLTEKQLAVVKLVTEGFKNAEVGAILCTSEHVVKNYLRAIYDKLGLWNRVELAMWYIKNIERGGSK